MSAHHLADFLRDVSDINPDFRARYSSLRVLIRRLRWTSRLPVPMTFNEAVSYCGSAHDQRLEKYLPAIRRLVSVWGKGGHAVYPVAQDTPRMRAEKIMRMCFRGDSRAPDNIFHSGFQKQNVNDTVRYQNYVVPHEVTPNQRLATGMSRGGDVSRVTAVCVSADMDLAALFPAPTADNVDEAQWLYVVMLRTGYNTHGRQILDALRGFKQLATHELGGHIQAQAHADRVDAIAMLLYGREMAADAIPSSDVLMAIKIKRRWNAEQVSPNPIPGQPPRRKPDFWQGGTYRIKDYLLHEDAIDALRGPWAAAFTDFVDKIDAGIIQKTRFVMPTPADGYRPSTGT